MPTAVAKQKRPHPYRKTESDSVHPTRAPIPDRSSSLSHLQRTAGNHAVGQFLQAKLAVSAPGDQYEQEADHVAERVMQHPQQSLSVGVKETSASPPVQRKVSGSGGGIVEAPPIVHEALSSSGQQLPSTLRQDMEERFDHDFSQVRVHSGTLAEQSAQDLDARAYTVGHDIVLGPGQSPPETGQGRRLMAHELAHVVQQEGMLFTSSQSHGLSEPTDTAEREADDVAETMEKGGRMPTIVSEGKGIQRDVGWARRGPLPDPYGELLVLNAFAKKFLDAAKLIHQNPAAMKLVNEAEAAGIQFGGYAEDGPGKTLGRAYTSGSTVYVPKTQTDPVMALRDFLFELNNGLRAPKFAELTKEATKGSKGTLSAKQDAYRMTEQEVEGMLRLGEIWFETKKTMSKGPRTDAYDAPFFLRDYEAVKGGRKKKEDLVKDVLKRVYDTGTLKGKTVEQYYTEAYEKISGGK